MRSLPLTNKAGPGGRPRETRAPRNAFADWLASCNRKPRDVVAELGKLMPKKKPCLSTIYNLRNGYFRPGIELAAAIDKLSGGKVPMKSWASVESRGRGAKKSA